MVLKGSYHSIPSKIEIKTNDQNIPGLFSNHFKKNLFL